MMDYTMQRYDSLWELDPMPDNYSEVLDVLNSDFRTFGEALINLIEKKAGKPIDDPIAYLKEVCKSAEIKISEIASENTLRNWFKKDLRPKKGEDSRRKMFALAFALGLTTQETCELFHKAYLDRAFNQRNYKELIYYYCIGKNLSFAHAEAMIEKVNIDDSVSTDKTMRTALIVDETSRINDDDALLEYIHAHSHNFSKNNTSAKAIAGKWKEKAFYFAQQQYKRKKLLKEAAENEGGKGAGKDIWNNSIFYGKNQKSDSFLYSMLTNRNMAGITGTQVVTLKNAVLPDEIKKNFPQVKSLADNVDSYEELRKVIILLFSYCFWNEGVPVECDTDDKYDEYTMQLDMLLQQANMPPLYYGNPYDWLFLYCTMSDQPLDTFQGILAQVLEDEE